MNKIIRLLALGKGGTYQGWCGNSLANTYKYRLSG